MTRTVAVDLDAVLGDTGPLWHAWLEDAGRRARVELGVDVDEASLDEQLGNWRPLLERFAENHAPVYLRPSAGANAELRRLQASGARIGAFTAAPEPLAGIAGSHLGVTRRLEALEGGTARSTGCWPGSAGHRRRPLSRRAPRSNSFQVTPPLRGAGRYGLNAR
jgi:phosphoglycolate phosphatase-like HAD superfamily hydrolase